MGWFSRIDGADAAQRDLGRGALRGGCKNRDEWIGRLKNEAESQRGKGTGGWSDADIDAYVGELDTNKDDGGGWFRW